ncbi:hypothetical protein BBI11_07810 [Planococcus maritimus]|uniref:type IV pilus modification PilV family protein n=1 Tax=Planococcus maritimus TaxID=192421 RepID=UPI00080F2993|nr:type II secretion system protein [Planococcus maritimus]ANU16931.1 hypothetical protein BBI11_07810 [Planococcus maritimus]
MENENGFTLVEVLASLVIISIVLMSFMAIFSNTNKLAVSNSEKLVVINLADAYLERVKVQADEYIEFPTADKCNSKEMPSFIYNINEKDYRIEVNTYQDLDECSLSLINVVVIVTAVDSNMSSSVEGYISDVSKD